MTIIRDPTVVCDQCGAKHIEQTFKGFMLCRLTESAKHFCNDACLHSYTSPRPQPKIDARTGDVYTVKDGQQPSRPQANGSQPYISAHR